MMLRSITTAAGFGDQRGLVVYAGSDGSWYVTVVEVAYVLVNALVLVVDIGVLELVTGKSFVSVARGLNTATDVLTFENDI